MKQSIMYAATVPVGGISLAAVDDANARRYSRDTQHLYRLVQDLRALVGVEHAEADELRERLAQYRLAHLDECASSDAQWHSTQDLLLSAEEAADEARFLLASVRGADESDAERAYREARAQLERAFFEYRQAHRELSVVAMYLRSVTIGR